MKSAKLRIRGKKILTISLMGDEEDKKTIQEFFQSPHERIGYRATEWMLAGIAKAKQRRTS